MKVLILACLVALALAKNSVESSSENEDKFVVKTLSEEQQQEFTDVYHDNTNLPYGSPFYLASESQLVPWPVFDTLSFPQPCAFAPKTMQVNKAAPHSPYYPEMLFKFLAATSAKSQHQAAGEQQNVNNPYLVPNHNKRSPLALLVNSKSQAFPQPNIPFHPSLQNQKFFEAFQHRRSGPLKLSLND